MVPEKQIESNYGYDGSFKDRDCLKEYGEHKVKLRDSKDGEAIEEKPDAVNCAYDKYKFESGDVDRDSLVKVGLLKGINKRLPIKILNGDTFSKKLNFVGIEKFSASATDKISKTGSTIK